MEARVEAHEGRILPEMGTSCSSLFRDSPLPRVMQVVSGDQSGNILMWNAQTGSCEGGFAFNAAASGGGGGSSMAGARAAGGAEGGVKLTAMGFDANQRRLLTASEAGACRGRCCPAAMRSTAVQGCRWRAAAVLGALPLPLGWFNMLWAQTGEQRTTIA